MESWAVVGRILPEMAAHTGLPADLKIVAGGGDNAAGIGLGAQRPGVGRVSLGTSGVLFAPLDTPTPDPQGRVHLFAHADSGDNLLCPGALQWFRDALAPEPAFAALLVMPAAGLFPDSKR